MAEKNPRVLGWGAIVAILVAVGLVVGLVVGALNSVMGLPPFVTTSAVGGTVGAVGALLIGRRRAALAPRRDGAAD